MEHQICRPCERC